MVLMKIVEMATIMVCRVNVPLHPIIPKRMESKKNRLLKAISSWVAGDDWDRSFLGIGELPAIETKSNYNRFDGRTVLKIILLVDWSSLYVKEGNNT